MPTKTSFVCTDTMLWRPLISFGTLPLLRITSPINKDDDTTVGVAATTVSNHRPEVARRLGRWRPDPTAITPRLHDAALAYRYIALRRLLARGGLPRPLRGK